MERKKVHYKCPNCGQEVSVMDYMTAEEDIKCPRCNQVQIIAFIFIGEHAVWPKALRKGTIVAGWVL